MCSAATRRRGGSTTSPSSRSERRRPHGWRSCGWRASTPVAATSCSPTGSMSRCSPPPPTADAEVSLNQADAHLINEDWMGGARVLKRYLALEPKSVRGREMLGWALEAGGDLEGELEVRRSLSDDLPSTAHDRDYGRALERAGSFPAARDRYKRALAQDDQPRRDAGDVLPAHALSHDARARGRRVAALRPAGVGLARAGGRVAAVRSAPQRRGVRLARRFVRLEREPGRRAERAREARHRHRSRRADCAGPSIGGVAAGVRRRALQRRRRAPTRPGPSC